MGTAKARTRGVPNGACQEIMGLRLATPDSAAKRPTQMRLVSGPLHVQQNLRDSISSARGESPLP